jgi:hypothetical protein
MHQFELLSVWSPVRVVAESEPIHQTSRQAAQRAFGLGRPHINSEQLVRRELSGVENFHLDTSLPTFSSPQKHFFQGLNAAIMSVPEILNRLAPEEPEVYAGEQNIRQTAVSTTATESDYMILCDTSAGGLVVSLFSATKAGRTLVIVKVSNDGNAVTVTAFGNDTIEGATAKSLTSQYQKAILTADGVSTWIDEGMNEV